MNKKMILHSLLSCSLLGLVGCGNTLSAEVEKMEVTEQSSITEGLEVTQTFDSSSSKMTLTSTTIHAIDSESAPIMPTLNDFTGGWIVPDLDMLFFFNNDGTYSDSQMTNVPIPHLVFDISSEGKYQMSFVQNGVKYNTYTLESDGTLSYNDRTYQPLDDATMEDYNARKRAEFHSAGLLDSTSAIEIVKQFMAGDNDPTTFDNYSFTDDSGMLYDDNNQPYYSIRIRQDAKNGMKSMAIGNVTIYAHTGECFWE